MKHILFVDDEQRILDGLRRMLFHKNGEWTMVFAPGGAEALAALAQTPFDVIVTDMRMPQIDGATLLQRVKTTYPSVVRIVLSGHTELEAALRSVPVAHQFLTKPCDAGTLEEVVNRACQLQSLLNDTEVKKIAGGIDRLPALPKTYQALTAALINADTTVKEIAAIVEQDIAISAKVLQLANSAFFGLSRRVTNITTAVTYMGLNMLKNLALSVEVFRSFDDHAALGISLEQVQIHSLRCAHVAKRLLKDQRQAEDAFMAGLLHDVGKLLLAAHLPDKCAPIAHQAQTTQQPLHIVEQNAWGVTHAEIGAYLLGLWGLPYPIIEAVANHHAPARVPHTTFDTLSAVYVADRLLQAGDTAPETVLDMTYLDALGVVDRIPIWQQIVADVQHASTAGEPHE